MVIYTKGKICINYLPMSCTKGQNMVMWWGIMDALMSPNNIDLYTKCVNVVLRIKIILFNYLCIDQ